MGILINFGLRFIAGIVVIMFHEIPKSIVAYYTTHPIYRKQVGIETKIYKYMDPIGLLMFVFMRIGWQKPYAYRPSRFSDKERGHMLVAFTGLVSNIVLILIMVPFIRVVENDYLYTLLMDIIICSISITVINFLPIPPFDMHIIMRYTAPDFYNTIKRNERIAHLVFIVFIASGFCLALVRGLANIVLPLI